MRIPIGNYLLTSDSHNIILNKVSKCKSGKNAGKEKLETIGYYSTVEAACQGILDQAIKESAATSIRELLEDVRRARQTIEDALKM